MVRNDRESLPGLIQYLINSSYQNMNLFPARPVLLHYTFSSNPIVKVFWLITCIVTIHTYKKGYIQQMSIGKKKRKRVAAILSVLMLNYKAKGQ